MIARCAALLLSVLLAACATPSVPPSFRLDSSKSDGVVSGSLSYDGRYSGYRVLYRRFPDGKPERFEIGESMVLIPTVPQWDFKEANLSGNVFAASLPAGEYEVFAWSVGSGYSRVNPTAPFSIRFRVEPGKMVYLGSFHFQQTSSMGLAVTGVSVSYLDRIERDLAMIKKKYPGLGDAPVAYAIGVGTNEQQLGGRSSNTITVPIFIPVGTR